MRMFAVHAEPSRAEPTALPTLCDGVGDGAETNTTVGGANHDDFGPNCSKIMNVIEIPII